jgi:hypothetical protein
MVEGWGRVKFSAGVSPIKALDWIPLSTIGFSAHRSLFVRGDCPAVEVEGSNKRFEQLKASVRFLAVFFIQAGR